MFNNIILSVMAWTTNSVGGFITKLKEERGQDLVEYVVIIGGIALLAAGAFVILDNTGVWDDFSGTLENCLRFDVGGCT